MNYLILSVGILISFQVLSHGMSTSTRRERQQERYNEYSNNIQQHEHEQYEETMRSLDDTNYNIN